MSISVNSGETSTIKKPLLSFWQIWNMNFGFFGVQFSFGLQQTNMSPIYKYLGAAENDLPLLWLAGPVTGLLVQPIIGAMSDKTWSPRWGRRKPYFLFGAILASIGLILMPYSSTLWMAASLLWILDSANNIALEPYRAFVADKLDQKQHSLGFLMQSFFTGLGSTLANFTPAILISLSLVGVNEIAENGIPHTVYWAFGIGAFASIASILCTQFTTPEYAPTEEEIAEIKNNKITVLQSVINSFKDVFYGLRDMPTTMIQLIPVKFFTWFAMFCYWQYITSTISSVLYNTTDEKTSMYKEAGVLTGTLNGTYNIVCFLVAFALVPLAIRIGAQKVHFISLLLGGLGLVFIPYLGNDVLFTIPNPFGNDSIHITTIILPAFGLGIAWASMLAMPYQMLAGAIPKGKNGIYMGIFNMFIVIPMMIQIFSVKFFIYDLLGNNPVNIVRLGGAFLILGGILSLFVKTKYNPITLKENNED